MYLIPTLVLIMRYSITQILILHAAAYAQPSKDGLDASLAFYCGFQLQPEISRLNSGR